MWCGGCMEVGPNFHNSASSGARCKRAGPQPHIAQSIGRALTTGVSVGPLVHSPLAVLFQATKPTARGRRHSHHEITAGLARWKSPDPPPILPFPFWGTSAVQVLAASRHDGFPQCSCFCAIITYPTRSSVCMYVVRTLQHPLDTAMIHVGMYMDTYSAVILRASEANVAAHFPCGSMLRTKPPG